MPAHPTEACYSHVIESGIKNLRRLVGSPDKAAFENELWHIEAVNQILSDHVLYQAENWRGEIPGHDRYWDEVRPKYLESAPAEAALEHYIAWEFLALATRFKLKSQITEEGEALRARLNNNGEQGAPLDG